MAKIDWTVSGRIMVVDTMMPNVTLDRDTVDGSATEIRPLSNVKVRVDGSTQNTNGFLSWGTVQTGADGSFTLSQRKSDKPRRFRVFVKFENDALHVKRPPGGWYSVFYSPVGAFTASPTLNIDERIFGDNTGNLGHQQDANAYYIAQSVVERLRDEGHPFTKKIHVDLFQRPLTGSSWAKGIVRHTANITADAFNPVTIIHEMMHLWNYQHNSGTTNWLGAIWGDSDTAGHQENPNVAFHEGFAEYAAWELMHLIWGVEKGLPYSRQWLNSRGFTTREMVERYWLGVKSCLRFLTADHPFFIDVGVIGSPMSYAESRYHRIPSRPPHPPRCCPDRFLDFFDVLEVFNEHPEAGWKKEWDAGDKDNGVFNFFARSADIVEGFSIVESGQLAQAIDPQGAIQMEDFCTGCPEGAIEGIVPVAPERDPGHKPPQRSRSANRRAEMFKTPWSSWRHGHSQSARGGDKVPGSGTGRRAGRKAVKTKPEGTTTRTSGKTPKHPAKTGTTNRSRRRRGAK